MINELSRIEDSLTAFGIKVPVNPDFMTKSLGPNTKFVNNKAVTLFLRAVFAEDRTVTFEKFDEGVRLFHCIRASANRPKGICYEAVKGDPNKDFWGDASRGIMKWFMDFKNVIVDVASETQHDPRMSDLLVLSERLSGRRSISAATFEKGLKDFLEPMKLDSRAHVIVCADVSQTPSIQRIQFFRDLSDVIENRPSDGSLDAFGNSSAGADDKMGLVASTEGIGKVRIFTRNDQNLCLSRYGKNSVHTFPMGTKTRDRLVALTEFIFRKENELNRKQRGIWYMSPPLVELRRKNRGAPTDFVITTLFPDSNVFDFPPETMSREEWVLAVSSLLEARIQGNVAPRGISGEILIGRKFEDQSKNWSLLASMTMSLAEIEGYVDDWAFRPKMPHSVGPYRSALRPPAIPQVHYYLNRIYRQSSTSLISEPKLLLSLETLYSVFATRVSGDRLIGNSTSLGQVIDVCAAKLSRFFIKVDMLRRHGDRSFLTLLPFIYVLLHKHYKGAIMNWAHMLGQIFGYSNEMYRNWFRYRGMNSPEFTIAQRLQNQTILSPTDGFAAFQRLFAPCHRWYESRVNDLKESEGDKGITVRIPFHYYNKMCRQLMELTNGVFPSSMTSAEQLSYFAGYHNPMSRKNEVE